MVLAKYMGYDIIAEQGFGGLGGSPCRRRANLASPSAPLSLGSSFSFEEGRNNIEMRG